MIIYETFKKFPYEFITSLDRPGFCTVLYNKTIVSKEYYTFGMYPIIDNTPSNVSF